MAPAYLPSFFPFHKLRPASHRATDDSDDANQIVSPKLASSAENTEVNMSNTAQHALLK